MIFDTSSPIKKNTMLSFSLQFHFQKSKSWKTGSRETLPVLAPASATVVLFVCTHHPHAPVVWALFANVKVAERKIFVFFIQGWNSAGGSRRFPFVVVNTHTHSNRREDSDSVSQPIMTNPFNWELKSHLLQPIADYSAVWQRQGQAWLMTKTFSQLKGARRQSSASSQSADGRWRRNYWLVLTERSSDCSKEFQAVSRSVKFWLNYFCQPQQRFTELAKSRKRRHVRARFHAKKCISFNLAWSFQEANVKCTTSDVISRLRYYLRQIQVSYLCLLPLARSHVYLLQSWGLELFLLSMIAFNCAFLNPENQDLPLYLILTRSTENYYVRHEEYHFWL